MNTIIYILSGILILLSLQLVIRTVIRKKSQPENIWGDPPKFPKKKHKSKKLTYPKTAPPTYLFRQQNQ